MNVIIISLDCVRTEALSCYPESFAYHHRVPYQAETPNIDTIAADGLVFQNAFCQAPFTPASHASLFTGQNPYRHGIRGMFSYKLKDDVETMAERFSAEGYDTGGFIGAHALSSRYNLNRGFDTYDEEFDAAYENWIVGNRRPCREVTTKALDWLDRRTDEYFLFLHYFDAHDGGRRRASDENGSRDECGDGDGNIGHVRGFYNNYVRSLDEAIGSPTKRVYRSLLKFDPNKNYGRRYHLQQVQRIDEQIGNLITTLQDRGEYEETTIVVLSDHGESFGEHGEYGHRKYIYDTTVRIPLIVKPGREVDVARGFHEGVVRSIDVYPTVAEAAGIETGTIKGRSLYEGVADNNERKAYAETRLEKSPETLHELETDLVGIRGIRWKLIQDCQDGSLQLYDLDADPREQDNVTDEYPDIRDDLTAELNGLLSDALNKEEHLVTEGEQAAIRDHLEGLGYL